MKRLIAEGCFPSTSEVSAPGQLANLERPYVWFEHEALEFPCYPHEITALQLFDAAQLTLKIAMEAGQQGWILKDASAWNVLFSRGRPVFVDLLSFERLGPTPSWIAYGQFVRHFLLPLLLHRKLGITPPEIFVNARDGITPEHAHRLLRGPKLLSAAGIELVLLPQWLSRRGSAMIAANRTPRAYGAEISLQLLLRTMRRLQGILERLRPVHTRSTSVWSGYEESRQHYTEMDLEAKRQFIRQWLGPSRAVLDLGCNAGEFSLLAADGGRTVVAADSDHVVLCRLYERIRDRGAPITPMMLNIGRPTPAVGWENREIDSFLTRSVGRFDCILVLGLMHHLVVNERVTLPMLAELLHRFEARRVIFEWVSPADEKFQQVAGLNRALYADLDESQLEKAMSQRFTLTAKSTLPCRTRVMYLWER
jgi:SAM-dependent methyltransferase